MFCSRCGTEVQVSSRYCPTCGLDMATATPVTAVGQPAQPDEADMVRDALKDEYEIDKELGRGGMAIVFKARDKQLEREVAIKVLPFSLSFDAEFVERFQREARTSAKLEHPNIIPIYRVGKSGRIIYFVMKFIRGRSLSNVIEARGALPPAEIRRLLAECARALGYAHRNGIVHRDIKPDNIMFDELGQAIVTDFGIAKAQSGAKLTGTGMSIGTPHYMSPEQARAQSLDGRSDLYSLGVVGYQCLTGHVPFDGEDSFSIGYKHIMEELPTPPLETAEQRDLFPVVQKMMAKKVEDRFQTAEELVAALEGSGPIATTMISDVAAMPTAAMPSISVGTAAATPLPRASVTVGGPGLVKKRRSRGALIAAGVVAVLAAGGGSVVMLRRSSPPGPSQDTAQAGVTGPTRPGATRGDTGAAALTPAAPAAAAGRGTLVLSGLPARARVTVDDQPQSGPRITLPAGDHRVVIVAEGYQAFTRTVRIQPEVEVPLQVAMREAAAEEPAAPAAPVEVDCDNRTQALRNPERVCYDERPSPRAAAGIPIPDACGGEASPAVFVVYVLASGEVSQALPLGRSSCQEFSAAALEYVRHLTFRPAQKDGQAVAAWIQQPIVALR